MTKLRSKKMTKSTFAIIIMAIAMVAMLAFGGTYAYFTAESKDAATTGLKTGIVEIKLGDATAITITKNNAVPGQKFLSAAEITLDDGDSTVDFYAFAKVSTTATIAGVNSGNPVELFYANVAKESLTLTDGKYTTASQFTPVVSIALADVNDTAEGNGQVWAAQTDANVYGAKYSELTDGKITLDGTFAQGVEAHREEGVAEVNNVYYFDGASYVALTTIEGVDLNVTVSFYAIQVEGIQNVAAAYDLVKAEF